MPNALGLGSQCSIPGTRDRQRTIFLDGISMIVFKKRGCNKKRKTRLLFAVMDALVDLKSESVKKCGVKI